MTTPFQAEIIPATPFQQNCALIWCTKTQKGVVTDPGDSPEAVIAAAKKRGVTIEKILLTHGHLDHASGATALSRATGAPVFGPQQEDSFLLEHLADNRTRPGFEHAEACRPEGYWEDGDSVSFGEVTFQVLHCPGHTPGHVVYFCEAARFAFVGDVIFAGSVGRTDLWRGNHEQLITSIKTKLLPLGDDVEFLPGHGSTSSFGHEKAWNPYLRD